MHRIATFLSIFSLLLAGQVSYSQTDSTSSFDQIVQYGANFDALQEKFKRQSQRLDELIKQRDEALRRLDDSQRDLQQVANKSAMGQMQAMVQEQNLLRTRLTPLDRRNPAAITDAVQNIDLQSSINLTQIRNQIQQLDVASQLIYERQYKIIVQLQQVADQVKEYFKDSQKLIEDYLDASDIAGVESQLQNRAAIRALDRADVKDLGAMCALGIALIRDDQLDAASEKIEFLKDSPLLRPIGLAMQGEVLARKNEKAASKKAFSKALLASPNNPRVFWMRAQAYSILKEPKFAMEDWDRVLRSGKYEIAARRGWVLSCSQQINVSEADKRQAKEHAELARALAGKRNWSCTIALAIATAMNNDQAKAADIAQTAAELAVAEKKTICIELAEQLKNSTIPPWAF
jgi:hypothetical protein